MPPLEERVKKLEQIFSLGGVGAPGGGNLQETVARHSKLLGTILQNQFLGNVYGGPFNLPPNNLLAGTLSVVGNTSSSERIYLDHTRIAGYDSNDVLQFELRSSDGVGSIPANVIVIWTGLLTAIPIGWSLCDGTGNTPDLRNKFIKGTTIDVDPGTTGGTSTHQHSTEGGHIGHGTHQHSSSGSHSGHGTHQHNTEGLHTGHGSVDMLTPVTYDDPDQSERDVASSSHGHITGAGGHDHDAIGDTTSRGGHRHNTIGDTDSAGSHNHDTKNHEPPYFTVAYIMKD